MTSQLLHSFSLVSSTSTQLLQSEGILVMESKHMQKKARHCLYALSLILIFSNARASDYAEALTKSLLYFEAQRSGRLPYNQRVPWRDHSGLTDGLEQGVKSTFL